MKKVKKPIDWNSLNPAEQRVEIARDVLKQIRCKKLVAERGSWVYLCDQYAVVTASEIQNHVPLKQCLAKAPVCHVCAIGSLFVGVVNRDETFLAQDLSLLQLDTIRSRSSPEFRQFFLILNRYFDFEQLQQMEAMFELRKAMFELGNRTYVASAVRYGFAYADSEDRLCAIMKNIIRNKGEFKIPKKYH